MHGHQDHQPGARCLREAEAREAFGAGVFLGRRAPRAVGRSGRHRSAGPGRPRRDPTRGPLQPPPGGRPRPDREARTDAPLSAGRSSPAPASMILDTTVLVDLQRELRRSRPGPAAALLARAGDASIFIAFVSAMEFAEGFGDDERSRCERFLSPFHVLWPDADTAWHAARLSRALAGRGMPIGDHDLSIAALARQHGQAVVSRNDRPFRRVPGLTLRTY